MSSSLTSRYEPPESTSPIISSLAGRKSRKKQLPKRLEGIERLDRSVFFFFIGVRIYPGTSLYDMAIAERKIDSRTDMLRPVFYTPDGIDLETIKTLVIHRASGRRNWVTGSGDKLAAETSQILHRRGIAGPLWEFLTG